MDFLISLFVTLSQGIAGVVVSGLALLLIILALIRKDAGMMVFAALLTLPVTYMAGAWTGLLLVVRLMPLFLLLSALAISRDETIFMWALPLPPFFYLGYYLFNLLVSDFRGIGV